MLEKLNSLSERLDSITGTTGTLGYLILVGAVVLGYNYTNMTPPTQTEGAEQEEEEQEPPRNFTTKQLRHFDGTFDEKAKEQKQIYLSVNGTVFDATDGRDFYGPEGPYAKFAGRECGVALAMMSFDEEYLDDLEGCKTLSAANKDELQGWIDKFTFYRPYPIKGRLVPDKLMPDPDKIVTKEELESHTGSEEVPEGYGAAPIYVGAGDKVYDMSFGGVTFYGLGGPYNKFAGRDASRALALMSLDVKDLDNNSTEDLTEKQLKTMNDWIKTFSERKGYPVVGKLDKK